MHKLMAQKGIWRAGTETPQGLDGHPVSAQAYERTVAGLKNAYENKVPLTFSTDADYWVAGKTRGEVCLEFLKTWQDAGIPNAEILRAMTLNGYKVSGTETTRGPIKAGFFADLIAVPGNPLDDVAALKNVQFVMKDGLVFKQNGVMTPGAFFNGGPVNGWRIR
jgi:imidazolonepropionase-like amidohydrolase